MEEIKLEGNLLYFDKENLNGRKYPRKIAEDIISQFNKVKETGSFLGELGYPKDPEKFEINLSNVSHEVEKIHIDEDLNSIVGTIKILDTPSGIQVRKLLEEGHRKFLCRPRGTGGINENKEIENFNLQSFDLVEGPDSFSNIKENDFMRLVDKSLSENE